MSSTFDVRPFSRMNNTLALGALALGALALGALALGYSKLLKTILEFRHYDRQPAKQAHTSLEHTYSLLLNQAPHQHTIFPGLPLHYNIQFNSLISLPLDLPSEPRQHQRSANSSRLTTPLVFSQQSGLTKILAALSFSVFKSSGL
jgi:hypothetical protein